MIKPAANYISDIKKAIKKLPPKERSQLIESLQKESWQERFKQLLKRIDARLRKHPISQRELTQLIEEARIEYHAQSSH